VVAPVEEDGLGQRRHEHEEDHQDLHPLHKTQDKTRDKRVVHKEQHNESQVPLHALQPRRVSRTRRSQVM
jgi:hypothetical protein